MRTNPGHVCVQFPGNYPGNFALTASPIAYGVGMGHDAPKNEPQRAVAVISGDRYRPGMTAADVKRANGLVIVGDIPDDAKATIEKFAAEHGHRVEIVIVEPEFMVEVTPPKFKDLQAFVIEHTEQFTVSVRRERVNTPPWMGKRPWWQR